MTTPPASPSAESIAELLTLIEPPHTKKRIAVARAACEAILADYPLNFAANSVYGQIGVIIGDSALAVRHLKPVVAAQPDNHDLRAKLGGAYYLLRRYDMAAEQLWMRLKSEVVNGKVRLNKGNLQIASMLGTCLMHLGRYDQAADFFLKIVDEVALQQIAKDGPTAIPSYEDIPPSPPRRVFPILYLPVEVKARELESKLLIAIHAAAAGMTVVLGASWNLLWRRYTDLPAGVVLFKTMNTLDGSVMKGALQAGHMIAALDEEAFGRANNDRVFRLNVDAHAIARTDLVLAQGEDQLDVMKRVYPRAVTKAVVTGNPKSDLFRPAFRAHDLDGSAAADEPDGYVLVCLMSGNVNNNGRTFASCAESTLSLGGLPLASGLGRDYIQLFRECAAFEMAMIPQITAVIRHIATTFPGRRVVVRPHPVEELSLWHGAFHDLSNVGVRPGGALTQWLPKAAAVVYITGCGSGLESFLFGVPSIRFDGDGRVVEPGTGISGRLNSPTRTPADVVDLLTDIFAGRIAAPNPDDDPLLEPILHRRKGHLVVEDIAAQLVSFAKRNDRGAPVPVAQIVEFGRARTQPFRPGEFQQRKFPDTSHAEIMAAMDRLCSIAGITMPMGLREIEWNTFLIQAMLTDERPA